MLSKSGETNRNEIKYEVALTEKNDETLIEFDEKVKIFQELKISYSQIQAGGDINYKLNLCLRICETAIWLVSEYELHGPHTEADSCIKEMLEKFEDARALYTKIKEFYANDEPDRMNFCLRMYEIFTWLANNYAKWGQTEAASLCGKEALDKFSEAMAGYKLLTELYQKTSDKDETVSLCLKIYQISTWFSIKYKENGQTEEASWYRKIATEKALMLQQIQISLLALFDCNRCGNDLNRLIDIFFHMLKNTDINFQTLNITSYNLDYDITAGLMKAVVNHKSLTELTLDGFSPHDIKTLGEALIKNQLPNLISLKISAIALPLPTNNAGKSWHLEIFQIVHPEYYAAQLAMINALKVNKTLINVTLDRRCFLLRDGDLANILEENTTLEDVSITDRLGIVPEKYLPNDPIDIELSKLITILQKNNTLLQLNISGNRFNLDPKFSEINALLHPNKVRKCGEIGKILKQLGFFSGPDKLVLEYSGYQAEEKNVPARIVKEPTPQIPLPF